MHADVRRSQHEPLGLLVAVRERLEGLRGGGLGDGRELRVLVAVGDRVEAQKRGLLRGRQLPEMEAEPRIVVRAAPHDYRAGTLLVARGRRGIGIGPALGQVNVVRVGIENHHAQTRLRQEALEQDAERVGLAGAGLPAQKGVPAESACVELERHAGRKRELADAQRRAGGAGALAPGSHLSGRGASHAAVVERAPAPVEQRAFALRGAHRDLSVRVREPPW